MSFSLLKVLAIPFIGTSLGAALVFFFKNKTGGLLVRCLNGFAAGVMIAASVWSLIMPSLDLSGGSFIPAAVGFWVGIIFFYLLDKLIWKMQSKSRYSLPIFKKSALPLIAITIHNFPEGMALGVAFAAWQADPSLVTYSSIIALSAGIAVQNCPEGAIISLPLYSRGIGRFKAFLLGVFSAIVETLGSLITVFAAGFLISLLPYIMCFAAGAMIYVVVDEMWPTMSDGKPSDLPTLLFVFGFSLMMILDVALG